MKLHAFTLSMMLVIGCGSSETPARTAEPSYQEPARAEEVQDQGMCQEAPDNDCAIPPDIEAVADAQNVLGEPLDSCSTTPLTGFRRTGRCETGPEDRGVHVVCAEMTEAFLTYTQNAGNDLSTPRPEYGFQGLTPGDRWCLCAARWADASTAGFAPPVVLGATEDTALRTIELSSLQRASHAN